MKYSYIFCAYISLIDQWRIILFCEFKVFNLIPSVNETRLLVQLESYECKSRLKGIICNSKMLMVM